MESRSIKKPGLSEAAGALFIIFGLLVFFSVFSRNMGGEGSTENLVGTFGHHMSAALMFLFGDASYFLGPFLIFMGGLGIYQGNMEDPLPRILSLLVILISLSVLFHLFGGAPAHELLTPGGIIGRSLGSFTEYMFGGLGSTLVAGGIFLTSLFLSLRMPLPVLLDRIQDLFFKLLIWSGAAWLVRSLQFQGESSVNFIPKGSGAFSQFIEKIRAAEVRQPVREKPDVTPAKATPAPVKAQTVSELKPVMKEVSEKTESPVYPSGESLSRSATDIQLPDPEEIRFLTTASLKSSGSYPHNSDWFRKKTMQSGATGMAGSLKRLAGELKSASEKTGVAAEKTPVFRMEYQTVLLSRGSAGRKPFFEGKFSPDETRFHFRRTERTAVKQKNHDPLLNDENPRLLSEIDLNLWDAFHPSPSKAPEPETVKNFSPTEQYQDESPVLFEEDEDLTEISDAEIEAGPADIQFTPAASPRKESAVIRQENAVNQSGNPEPPLKEEELSIPNVNLNGKKYRIPVDRLSVPVRQNAFDLKEEIDSTRARLEQVMKDYGVAGKVVDMQRGPILTRYEVKLEPGMRVNRIMGISDEIKMNLEAASIRIVAPIPGKATVGIEIPNRHRDPVSLGEMVRLDPEFFAKTRDLSIVLGKDISGANCYVDLARLPHLLIAGATGAGKSVYMNSVIASLLYTQSPEDVRFIMIDPKMVELKLYEGIPHLLMPVITDVKKASRALNWAVQEMEYRYSILSKARCRDIRSYNEKFSQSDLFSGKEQGNRMPYIILLIDELADLMMVAAKDVEDSIIRLTQKARAVGIHVIMATQRPSVDVITALIKANCPARISFHVAQRTDSRTIMDANGAETLLGKGDMLFKSPVSTELKRIQAPLITEKEIETIVNETRRFGNPSYIDLDDDYEGDDDGADDIDDSLFNEAWDIIRETGKTSTSYIQRRLRIGYNRAANLMELFERRGYLSEAIGNKPREILRQE